MSVSVTWKDGELTVEQFGRPVKNVERAILYLVPGSSVCAVEIRTRRPSGDLDVGTFALGSATVELAPEKPDALDDVETGGHAR